jgi:hypothetical protein
MNEALVRDCIAQEVMPSIVGKCSFSVYERTIKLIPVAAAAYCKAWETSGDHAAAADAAKKAVREATGCVYYSIWELLDAIDSVQHCIKG